MKRSKLDPYLLILPAVLFVAVVYAYPIYHVIADSFFRIDGAAKTFVGLSNYQFILFQDETFRISLLNNIKLLLGVPILVILALTLAYLLFTQIKGWQVFRFIFILPYILSITAISITFDYLLRENGLFNAILHAIGMGSLARNWLGDVAVAIYSVLGVVVWKEFGFGVILFLARMMSIDRQVIEAATVDGASSFQIFWHVVLPEMTNVVVFYVVINTINMLSWMFNYIFVMTRGGPIESTYVLEYYIYQTGIRYRQYGLSSTLAVILLLLAIGFVVGQALLRQRITTGRAS